MHDNRPMLLKHIDRILDERIRPAILHDLAPVEVEAWELVDREGPVAGVPGAGEPIAPQRAMAPGAPYRPVSLPAAWGPAWGTTWFRLRVALPAHLRTGGPGLEGLELDLDLGWADHSPGFQCEALVRSASGEVVKAVNPRNRWVPLLPGMIDEQGVALVYLEAASNPLLLDIHPFLPTEEGSRSTQSHEPLYTFRRAALVEVRHEVRDLAADVEVLEGLARVLPESSPRAWQLLTGLSRALDHLDLADVPGTAARVRGMLTPLLEAPAHGDAITLGAVGHAHIDSAWLWPVRETRRKVARTLANALRLLDDGAPMVFALPAAQHLAWLQQDEPALFERVRRHVAAGRIVPVGGMWVEPDAVLPSGESLARQLTEGTAFFRQELGAQCHEIWLPDSFGYSASLPQLAHLAGYDSFLTQKISWNQVDDFPHHTLWWEGIDGTRIFTHFPPADTYGAEVGAEELERAQSGFKDKGRTDVELFLYGYGDGGGGPTREMLQRIERTASLAGSPRMEHMSPREFFERARAQYPDAPVWVGELYLEKHRGTLTTQAATKRGNRRAEAALREAETWCTTAWVRGLLPAGYPHTLLRDLWRATLLCQFHDILPGSSIAWVYEDARAAQDSVIATALALSQTARRALATGVPVRDGDPGEPPARPRRCAQTPGPADEGDGADPLDPADPDQAGAPGPTIAFNTAPVGRDHGGAGLAPMGAALLPAGAPRGAGGPGPTIERTGQGVVVDNGLLRARFTPDGAVASLLVRHDGAPAQEVVPPGQRLGVLQIAQDLPNEWDAWDLDPFYRGSLRELAGSLEAVEERDGVVRVVVEVAFGASRAWLRWTLAAGSSVLGLDAEVDWRESEKVLKLALPVDVHTDHAVYGSQFGHLRRPTHENTSWEAYRFEVCAHKWLHVGEPGRGLGVANDSTYGWDITRHSRQGAGTWSLVRATLLRAPRFPDPRADRGVHRFGFRLLACPTPDAVREEAYRLDLPVRELALPAGTGLAGLEERVAPLVRATGAVVESLHAADDGSGDVLVRLYEARGARSRVILSAPEMGGAVGADLHGAPSERGVRVEPAGAQAPGGRQAGGAQGAWAFELHPFGVATIRLSPRRPVTGEGE
ncbi:alpha-mannosidase [Actinomyces capricornis]|uniref:Alpha-mannosidase n=1 Tax=Actinomyces capricornis TaxID=2755559 RepID=A0ABN6K4W5_9ACTO|nr:alpha-mannosidase [Actinomyces capricornis]BDA64598.1 alpha-mannosidase [Actinomyces capricornis]